MVVGRLDLLEAVFRGRRHGARRRVIIHRRRSRRRPPARREERLQEFRQRQPSQQRHRVGQVEEARQ